VNDPIGDMIARIRNAADAQARQGLDARLQAAQRVLDVLQVRRLHPRLFARCRSPGRTEFEIELKYFDGEPVIARDRARLQAGPPRLFVVKRPEADRTAWASRSCRRPRA
jgi:small subunit ribosomal protein S8